MTIELNGERRESPPRTLGALWEAETGTGAAPVSRRGFAIALNGEVVKGQRWDDTEIKDGDRIEIIRAMAGG